MNNVSKNAKYLTQRDRTRYYRLLELSSDSRTDSDIEEIAEIEARADRRADREQAVSGKRMWEE